MKKLSTVQRILRLHLYPTMFSGGASALLLVLSVLAALTPGAWASPEEHVEEYYGADAARSAPAASPPKEVSAAVAAYNRLQLPASDPLHPNYFEHIPKDGFTDWKDLRSFVEFGAWGIKEMCEELDRWKPYTPPHLQPLPLPPTPSPLPPPPLPPSPTGGRTSCGRLSLKTLGLVFSHSTPFLPYVRAHSSHISPINSFTGEEHAHEPAHGKGRCLR